MDVLGNTVSAIGTVLAFDTVASDQSGLGLGTKELKELLLILLLLRQRRSTLNSESPNKTLDSSPITNQE